jgi:predicted nucleic acid-binding protein
MPHPSLKLYLDSSVPNYVFNDEYPEKQKAAKELFRAITAKRVEAYFSIVTAFEID